MVDFVCGLVGLWAFRLPGSRAPGQRGIGWTGSRALELSVFGLQVFTIPGSQALDLPPGLQPVRIVAAHLPAA